MTDDEEFNVERENKKAFWHNSCKKLAQLSNVSVMMIDSKLDREIELRRLFLIQDNKVENQEAKYLHQLKNIARDITKHQKEVENRVKQEYMQKYERLKKKFEKYKEEKEEKLESICNKINSKSKDLMVLSRNIHELHTKVSSSNNDFLLKSYEAKKELNLLSNELEKHNEKLRYIEETSEKNIKELVEESKRSIEALKDKIKHYKELKSKSFDKFMESTRGTIHNMKKSVRSFRMVYENIIEKNVNFKKEWNIKREGLMNDIKIAKSKLIDSYEKKMSVVQSNDISEIEEKKTELVNKRILHLKELESINSQLDGVKSELYSALKQKEREIEQQNIALLSINNDIAQQFEKERDEVVKYIEDNDKEIDMMVNETDFIKNRLKGLIQEINNSLQIIVKKNKEKYDALYNKIDTEGKNIVELIKNRISSCDELKRDFEETFVVNLSKDLIKLKKDLELQKDEYLKEIRAKENRNSDVLSKLIRKLNNKKSLHVDNLKNGTPSASRIDESDFYSKLKQKKISIEERNRNRLTDISNIMLKKRPDEESEKRIYLSKRSQLDSMKSVIMAQLSASYARYREMTDNKNKEILECHKLLSTIIEKYYIHPFEDLINDIENDFNTQLQEFRKEQGNLKDDDQTLLYKLFEDRLVSLYEITKMKLEFHMEKSGYAKNIAKADETLDILKVNKDQYLNRFEVDSEIKAIESVIAAKEEEITNRKDNLKKQWEDKDIKILQKIKDIDMQMSKLNKIKDSKLAYIETKYKEGQEKLIEKHRASKEMILNKINMAIKQREQIEEQNKRGPQTPKSTNNIIISDGNKLLELSKKETDLITEYFAESSLNETERKERLRSIDTEISNTIKECCSMLMKIDSSQDTASTVTSTSNSPNDKNKSPKRVKSKINSAAVLPSLSQTTI